MISLNSFLKRKRLKSTIRLRTISRGRIASYVVLVGIAITSALIALKFENNNSIRDMATGAFSGAVIGGVLFMYEQVREEERDEKQWERDRAQAKRLRDDANRDADLSTFANLLLNDIQPTYNKFFNHYRHTCDSWKEVKDDWRPLIKRGGYLVKRIEDDYLVNLYEDFWDKAGIRSFILKKRHDVKTKSLPIQANPTDEHVSTVQTDADTALNKLIVASERILKDYRKI